MPFGIGSSSDVSQSNVTADTVAGRDNNNNSNNRYINNSHNYYSGSHGRISHLAMLGLKFLQEQESNQQINYIIDRLNHYYKVVDAEAVQVIGLEQKLNNGGYEYYIDFAMRAKELFAKHLFKYQFSESAQKMYAFLLAKVYTCFQTHIYPAILRGKNKEDIMDLVRIHIHREIEDALGENILELYDEEIAGMVYFLTGNCHIKWN